MVILKVKRGEENLFLFDSDLNQDVEILVRDITAIYNGRLKVYRICSEMEELANHGIMLPQEMMGLNDDQIEELKLKDVWAEKCIPSGGYIFNRDTVGRRNGQAPQKNMQTVLKNAMEQAKGMIDKKIMRENKFLTLKIVQEAINILRGAVTIVYPMNLPPHDTIRMEFTNTEDLSGTQASREVIEPSKSQLWFAGRQLIPGKKLSEFIGTNDKTKVVIKINKHGEGPPGREPVFTEAIRKQMMAESYRRQEELKKLQQDDDDTYLNSSWADSNSLKRQAHGIEKVNFRFGK